MSRRRYESQEPFGDRTPDDVPLPYDPVYQPDVTQAQRVRGATTIIGVPPSDSRIVGVYDARPINSEDFLVSQYFVEGSYSSPQSITFTVPDGLVAIMRWFTLRAYSSVVDIYGDSTTTFNGAGNGLTLSVDGVAGKSYDLSDPFGGDPMVDRFPCYLLANAGSVMRLTLTFTAVTGSLYMAFYGQLLISSGRPLTHEPGVSLPEPVYVVSNPNPKVT
jgi:hypothetical protein